MQIYVSGSLPQGRRRKSLKLTDDQREVVAKKIDGMVNRRYLTEGHVTSSLHYFAVPKGTTDVRIVYDGTSCGLNESLWAPNFFLPSSKSAALVLSFSTTWMADANFGEMFHNFPMDERIQKHSGVDVGQLRNHLTSGAGEMVRWARLFMGMKPSPYNSVRHCYWCEEFARGDPARVTNPMRYDRIRLNLPGMTSYDPQLPKLMKWNELTGGGGKVDGDITTFVDDVRMTGYSKENCLGVHRQFASMVQYNGPPRCSAKVQTPVPRECRCLDGHHIQCRKKKQSLRMWVKTSGTRNEQ